MHQQRISPEQELIRVSRQEHICRSPMKRKHSLSGCLALPGIKALSHDGDEFDNVRLQKRYLSEAMANDMKRLSMAFNASQGPQSPGSSGVRSDIEDHTASSSGHVTPMECNSPVHGSPSKAADLDDSSTGARSAEASPSHGNLMELDLHTPRRPSCLDDTLASTVDRHDGLGQSSPSDHSCLDLRKAALLRSHMRRTEACRGSRIGLATEHAAPRFASHLGALKTRLLLPSLPSHGVSIRRVHDVHHAPHAGSD